MSIISDALKKVADKRRDAVTLPERDFGRSFKKSAVKTAQRRGINWNILSGIGTVLIVCFAIVAFLYNTELFSSFIYPNTAIRPVVMPKSANPQGNAIVPNSVIDEPIRPAIAKPENVVRERPSASIFPMPNPKRGPELLSLILNGVIEGQGEPLAIINNSILKKGDFIEGAQIVNISSDRVTLLYDDKEILLRIK